MSDTALVLRARGGDQLAFEELANRFKDHIRIKALAYFLPDGGLEDLVQEGRYGLFKAVRDYRPDRKSGFRNFAEMCIQRQIVTAVKTATRQKHGPLNACLSFQESPRESSRGKGVAATLEEALPGPTDDDPLDHLCQREDLATLLAGLGGLTGLERTAILGIGEGRSYEEISEETGFTFKQIDNAAQRARRKLGDAMAVAA